MSKSDNWLVSAEKTKYNNFCKDNWPPCVARRPDQNDDNDSKRKDVDVDVDVDDQQQQNENNNWARKLGKKARHRNLEQLQEIWWQQKASMAFGQQGAAAAEGQEEMMAMQRLMEEPIAEE
jgi:hypothetical protein